METLPNWDLTTIYPDIASKEFEEDLQMLVTNCKKTSEAMAQFQERGDRFDTFFINLLEDYQKIWDLAETLGAYAHALVTVNTSDKKALEGLNRVEEVLLVAKALHVKVLHFLATHAEAVTDVLRTCETLGPYTFALEEMIEEQKHTMSEPEEALAADLSRSGTDAWSRLQEAISSSADVLWDEETGERKTVVQLRSLAFSDDRSVRKRAFNLELGIWKDHEIAFAYALNGVKGTTITLDQRRNYTSPLDRSIEQARITREVLDALIGTIEQNLGVFRTYLRAKATLLGVPKLAFYDLFAPVGSSGKRYSYKEAQDLIIENFSAFHQPLGEFARYAFDHSWIDSGSRAGKIGGAYCTSFPLRKETRILANYDYSFDGVSTLAHELGHAYHDKVTADLPALLRHYPMTLAETASIFSQFVVFQGALRTAEPEQRLVLIESFLQDSTQVCVDILSRFYFEQDLFTHRAKNELLAEQLSSLMIDAQMATYGDALDYSALHPYMWAVKGHYYRSDLSFYNYPYAFGQLFGLGVYRLAEDSFSEFGDRYDQLLTLTGQYSAPEVTKRVGCDITTTTFWQQSIDLIATYVDEFCTLSGYSTKEEL